MKKCPSCNIKLQKYDSVCPNCNSAVSVNKEIAGRNWCVSCEKHYNKGIYCADCGLLLVERFTENTAADSLIGYSIDKRYVIRERLGHGGMGVVYKGIQLSIGREVAIKVLRRKLAQDHEVVTRFMLEAKLTSKLQHPHVVSLYDFGITGEGLFYIIMEMLEGMTLAEAMNSQTFDLQQIITLTIQICDALDEAHSKDIIHRDLKPENIFLRQTKNGLSAKILDFGLAKVIDFQTCLSQTGKIFGTPAYMSPEQCWGKKVDHRSDIYSLGVIFYELVARQPLFKSESSVGYIGQHRYEVPRPVSEFSGPFEIPETLCDLIMAMLVKKPEDRIQTVSEVEDILWEIVPTIRESGSVSLSSSVAGIGRQSAKGVLIAPISPDDLGKNIQDWKLSKPTQNSEKYDSGRMQLDSSELSIVNLSELGDSVGDSLEPEPSELIINESEKEQRTTSELLSQLDKEPGNLVVQDCDKKLTDPDTVKTELEVFGTALPYVVEVNAPEKVVIFSEATEKESVTHKSDEEDVLKASGKKIKIVAVAVSVVLLSVLSFVLIKKKDKPEFVATEKATLLICEEMDQVYDDLSDIVDVFERLERRAKFTLISIRLGNFEEQDKSLYTVLTKTGEYRKFLIGSEYKWSMFNLQGPKIQRKPGVYLPLFRIFLSFSVRQFEVSDQRVFWSIKKSKTRRPTISVRRGTKKLKPYILKNSKNELVSVTSERQITVHLRREAYRGWEDKFTMQAVNSDEDRKIIWASKFEVKGKRKTNKAQVCCLWISFIRKFFVLIEPPILERKG